MTSSKKALTESLIHSILSNNEVLRGNQCIAYGGVNSKQERFFHVLKYRSIVGNYLDTMYEGSSAIEAAQRYIDLIGLDDSYEDAVYHNRMKRK